MSVPRLETARTVSTILAPSEAQRVLDYFSRNKARFEGVSPKWANGFFTVPYWEERLANAHDEWMRDGGLRLYVTRRGEEDGPIIAAISFTQFFRLALQRCILGYSVDGAYEGQGLLREALEAAITFVFDDLGFHRIEANYMPTNERSGNLLRSLGFQVEGYARDYLLLDGKWRDHVMTARINPRHVEPK